MPTSVTTKARPFFLALKRQEPMAASAITLRWQEKATDHVVVTKSNGHE
jgi:hypothetical protein